MIYSKALSVKQLSEAMADGKLKVRCREPRRHQVADVCAGPSLIRSVGPALPYTPIGCTLRLDKGPA